MKVSIRKISERTGFSPATVSNALNHKHGVNAETAAIIQKTALEMGYSTDTKVKKVKFVIYQNNGAIICGSQFHPAVIEGVESAAKENGLETVFVYLNRMDSTYEKQVQDLLADTTSAIILLGTELTEEEFPRFNSFQGNLILLDGWSDLLTFDAVLINNTDSAMQAVRYLIDHGHKQIGYIRGDFRINAFRYREIGYRRALEEANLEIPENGIITVGTKMESAFSDMYQYLAEPKKLATAYFIDNDEIAMGVMRALAGRGYRIPEDVSIIGFDNLAFGAISVPPLTTMNVYKQEMGRIAVQRLMELINHPSETKSKIQVCTSFVERESVRDMK